MPLYFLPYPQNTNQIKLYVENVVIHIILSLMKSLTIGNIEEKAFLAQKILFRMTQFYQKHPLPNLLIFSGPNKVLKHYVVLHKIAFYHLCMNKNSCKTCKACILLEKQEHPDFIIFPDDKVKIGDVKDPEPYSVRWLQKNILIYKPLVSSVRIVLFPAAEKLGLEAEIALLKTLEEPNPYTKFIFFTPSLDQLKDTIVSRGVNIPIKNFSLNQMQKITEINDYEFLEILGGSLDNFYSIRYEFYQQIKQKIIQALEHPLDLVELEDWAIQNSKTDTDNENLSENQFWELLAHVFLQCIRRSPLYAALAPVFIDFLIGLRAEQPGLNPYLTSRLFFELFYQIYLKTT